MYRLPHRARQWLFFFVVFIHQPLFGQVGQLAHKKWITSMSTIRGLPEIPVETILDTLVFHTDSVGRCGALQYLNSSGPVNQPRFKIRLYELIGLVVAYKGPCSSFHDGERWMKDALQASLDLGDDQMLYEVYIKLCSFYTMKSNFGTATLYGLMALELWDKGFRDNYVFQPFIFYNLGYNFYHAGEYRLALHAANEAITPPHNNKFQEAEVLNPEHQMYTWNLIGLCYEQLNKYDSAFYAFDKALVFAREHSSPFWIGLIKGNQGDVYYKMGQIDSAAVLLQMDYQSSIKAQQFDNAANTLHWLALIKLKRGQPEQALQMLRESMSLLNKKRDPTYLENILKGFADVFTGLDKADSASIYMQRYVQIHDSLQQVQYAGKAEIVKMRQEHEQSIYRINDLNKEKKRIVLIRNFIILFILLLLGLVLLYFNRQHLKMRIIQLQTLDEKRLAEQEVIRAQEQLAQLTQHLLERNTMVENMQEQMLKKELDETQVQHILELSNHTILTDADWNHFKELFDKVYPGFLIHLKNQAPDITLAEQRIAAMCRLNLHNKEAGTLLGISPGSVNKTKQRLKQRLNLDQDTDLVAYFTV